MPLLRNFTNLSWQDVLNKLEAPQNPYSTTAAAEHDKSKPIWSNSDLDPTPPGSRTWTWLHYTSFWLASSFATGTWTTGSAMIALGMPWYAAWLAVVVSHAIGAALLVANGRGPAAYHIGFPVYARASFGMWGSYFAIVSRCVVVSVGLYLDKKEFRSRANNPPLWVGGDMVCGECVLWLEFRFYLHTMHMAFLERRAQSLAQ